jgi:DNA mismatch repair protein MutS
VQVARLAGMPAAADAPGACQRWSAGSTATAAAMRRSTCSPRRTEEEPPALLALRELDVDACSPREALDALYRLKQLAAKT